MWCSVRTMITDESPANGANRAHELTEEMLLGSPILLRAITESTPDAVYVKDTQGRYRLLNSPAARFLGKPTQEILGKDDRAFFPVDDARRIMEDDRHILDAGITQTCEESFITAVGPRTFLVTKGPLHNEQGEIIGLFGMARNITTHH